MSKQPAGHIDVIRELRLRHWARMNYVSPQLRRETWHPIVLDEMRRRDEELAESLIGQSAGLGYVPLEPTGIRLLHGAHESYPDPKMLRQARPSESRSRAALDQI